MAQPTKEQVSELEKAHKEQFFSLVATNDILLKSQIVSSLPGTDKKRIAWEKLRNMLKKQVKTWVARNKKINSKITTGKIFVEETDFLRKTMQDYLRAYVRDWDKEKKGFGIIPVIIWAVVAVAGLFTADQVVDELNTTSEEKIDLNNSNLKLAKELGLNPEQAASLINAQQKQLTEGSGFAASIGTAVKWVGGIGTVLVAVWGGKKIYDSFK